MGSKKYMLKNGLGTMIRENVKTSKRVVDLFCGAGSIAWFVGEETSLPVIAVDLQSYATIFTGSVIERDSPVDPIELKEEWIAKVEKKLPKISLYLKSLELENEETDFTEKVYKSRKFCQTPSTIGPVFNAYGGYYFSPKQALIMDVLMKELPKNKIWNMICHAALIEAASVCAASPGHTAQPFQPTVSAVKFIEISWSKDVIQECIKALIAIAPRHANVKGKVFAGDAFEFIEKLGPNDLVIVDPPYSEVQYSRFYHVLETIARKKHYEVFGAGRYPNILERPQSGFSSKSKSTQAMEKLLERISRRGATLIVTFPQGKSSNGLSGDSVRSLAEKYFSIKKKHVYGTFSTLGGNNGKRAARQASNELILLMTPK